MIQKLLLLFTIGCLMAFTNPPKSTPSSSALAFYNWYLAKINSEEHDGPQVIQGINGNSKLDTTVYFKNLRKLGVVSELFIKRESDRLNGCAVFMKTVSWKQHRALTDNYEYDEQCPFMYYYYWIGSQEAVDKVAVTAVKTMGATAVVTIQLSQVNRDGVYPFGKPITVYERLEHGTWKITRITGNFGTK